MFATAFLVVWTGPDGVPVTHPTPTALTLPGHGFYWFALREPEPEPGVTP